MGNLGYNPYWTYRVPTTPLVTGDGAHFVCPFSGVFLEFLKGL